MNKKLQVLCGLTLLCSLSGQTIAPTSGPASSPRTSVSGLAAFGDSICVGGGATTLSVDFVNLLSTQLGGSLGNYCQNGWWIEDEPTEMFVSGPALQKQALNATNIEEGGVNDGNNCAASANCVSTSQLALQTILGWRSTTNIVLPSAASSTGTWSTDGTISSCKATSTNGSTITYSITSYGSSAIGVTVRAYDGDGGTGGVTIDSVAQAGFITSGVGGASIVGGARPSVFTYFYPVSAGSHTLVVTDTSATSGSNVVSSCGVISANQKGNAAFVGSARIWSMEIIPQYNNTNPTYHASINTMKQATVTQLAGWGFNVVWAPILNSPYAGAFDAVNYINNSAVTDPDGLSCGGATSDNVHPNNCGHKEMFNALMSDFAR